MTTPTDKSPDPMSGELVEELRQRAESYRLGGPSSEHTAALLDQAAFALTSKDEEIERLKERQHHFKDEDWPLALQRLKHMEPGPDQGLAIIGVDDLEFALERLAHFAEVAMGNAVAVSTAEARAQSAEAQVEGLKRALEPFAELYSEDDDEQRSTYVWPNDEDHWTASHHTWGDYVTVRMIKAARAALASLSQGKDQGASTETERRDGALLVPSQTPLSDALARRAYVTSGPHLSGHRVCIGFESSGDAFALHQAVARS